MNHKVSGRPLKFLVSFSLVVSFLPINISNSVAATYGAPSAPQSISQSASASGVALTWSAPASGSPTNYIIEKSTNGTTWSSVTTVSSTTTSYTISSGLTPSTAYYFRIAALAGTTQGAYGYPWGEKIYGTTTSTRDSSGNIVYESGFGIAAGDAFQSASASFSRIRYRLETTISSVAKYADVDFYKWSTDKTAASVLPTIDNLRIPSITGAANQFIVQANVTDLNVYSNNSAVTSGFGMDGRLEIWPWNYSQGKSGLLPAGDEGTFDYDDVPSGDAIYGSFQVHDLDNLKPIFVWNRHFVGTTAEIAYGKNPTSQPDWTFCRIGQGTCVLPDQFLLEIYVNSPITTSAVITPANTAVPTISGTTTFGETLTSTTGTWSNSPTSYTYQWSRSATSGGSYASIPTAINSTYRLEAADVGQYLKVTVTATNASGSAAATSTATAQIAKATPTFSTWTNVTKTFGDANYSVTAPTVTGSLAGSFSYSSSNTGVISISGSTFTVAGGGSATITATFTPTDTANYNSATTTNTVTVDKAAQSAITITTTTATYGTNLTLASTGGSTGGTYTYTKVSGNCTLSGAVLTPTATGSCVVQSSLATTADYLAETSTATTITISSGSVSASLTLEPGNLIFRQAKNITAVATVAGKITFRVAGKVLPGCKNKAVNASNSFTTTCSYRPSNHSYVTISATLNPTDNFYVGTVTNSAQYLVTRRVGRR
jgi:Fibronectin type III domain